MTKKISGYDDKDKLSTREYWDTVLEGANLPRINSPKDYNYYVTMKFVDSVLKNANKKTFLEIGAGSSGWLPYFAQKYGYKVSGLDYSEIGCKIAEKNLKLLDIKYDEIICEDIFKWKSDQKFDVIFTYGVVEHFEHPEDIIKICYDHLNQDGIIITLVPNILGLIGILSRIFVLDIYKMHKVISCETLSQIHLNAGFKEIKTNYVGTFSLAVIPWARSKWFLFKKGSIQRKMTMGIIWVFNNVISNFFKIIRLEIPTRFFSPYVISIMRKA